MPFFTITPVNKMNDIAYLILIFVCSIFLTGFLGWCATGFSCGKKKKRNNTEGPTEATESKAVPQKVNNSGPTSGAPVLTDSACVEIESPPFDGEEGRANENAESTTSVVMQNSTQCVDLNETIPKLSMGTYGGAGEATGNKPISSTYEDYRPQSDTPPLQFESMIFKDRKLNQGRKARKIEVGSVIIDMSDSGDDGGNGGNGDNGINAPYASDHADNDYKSYSEYFPQYRCPMAYERTTSPSPVEDFSLREIQHGSFGNNGRKFNRGDFQEDFKLKRQNYCNNDQDRRSVFHQPGNAQSLHNGNKTKTSLQHNGQPYNCCQKRCKKCGKEIVPGDYDSESECEYEEVHSDEELMEPHPFVNSGNRQVEKVGTLKRPSSLTHDAMNSQYNKTPKPFADTRGVQRNSTGYVTHHMPYKRESTCAIKTKTRPQNEIPKSSGMFLPAPSDDSPKAKKSRKEQDYFDRNIGGSNARGLFHSPHNDQAISRYLPTYEVNPNNFPPKPNVYSKVRPPYAEYHHIKSSPDQVRYNDFQDEGMTSSGYFKERSLQNRPPPQISRAGPTVVEEKISSGREKAGSNRMATRHVPRSPYENGHGTSPCLKNAAKRGSLIDGQERSTKSVHQPGKVIGKKLADVSHLMKNRLFKRKKNQLEMQMGRNVMIPAETDQ